MLGLTSLLTSVCVIIKYLTVYSKSPKPVFIKGKLDFSKFITPKYLAAPMSSCLDLVGANYPV